MRGDLIDAERGSMANLAEIVAALLAHVSRGQAAADTTAISLSEAYGQHPLLRHFSVPRPMVRDVTVELKFAVKAAPKSTLSLDEQQRGAVLDRLREVVGDLSRRPPIASSTKEGSSGAETFMQRIEALRARLPELVGGEGEVDVARVAAQVGEAIADAFRYAASEGGPLPAGVDADALKGVLKGDNAPSGPSSDDIARANDIARSEVLRVFSEVSGVSVAAGPSDLDILLTVDELASVRPESVGSLRFTIAAGDGEGSRDIVEGAGVHPDEP